MAVLSLLEGLELNFPAQNGRPEKRSLPPIRAVGRTLTEIFGSKKALKNSTVLDVNTLQSDIIRIMTGNFPLFL